MSTLSRRALPGLSTVLVLIAGCPTTASSQTAEPLSTSGSGVSLGGVRFDDSFQNRGLARSAPSVPSRRTWTVEVHGGVAGGSSPSGGTGLLPASGTPFAAQNGLESPAVNSWYFGDGTKWLNAELASIRVVNRVTPLDTLLTGSAVSRTRGADLGGRVARALSSRLDVEFTVDVSAGDYGVTAGTLTGLQTSATSFLTAWNRVLSALPSFSVTSQLSGTIHPGNQTFSTVTLNLFSRRGRFAPYLTGGAGIVVNHGDVSALLSGNLQFLADNLSKTETDSVSISFSEARVQPVVVIGTGFTQDLTARTGLRLDIRFYLSRNPDRTTLSASPVTTGTPTVDDLVVLGGSVLQFSGVPGTPSTLSVPVTNMQTFTASGLRTQGALFLGYFFRF
jgi:hypothetical protein